MKTFTKMPNATNGLQRFKIAAQFYAGQRILILFFLLSLAVSGFSQSDATLVWAKSMVNPPLGGGVVGNSIRVDADGNSYITGYFSGTADLDPGAGTANLTNAGGADIFFARYDAPGSYTYKILLGRPACGFHRVIGAIGYVGLLRVGGVICKNPTCYGLLQEICRSSGNNFISGDYLSTRESRCLKLHSA